LAAEHLEYLLGLCVILQEHTQSVEKLGPKSIRPVALESNVLIETSKILKMSMEIYLWCFIKANYFLTKIVS